HRAPRPSLNPFPTRRSSDLGPDLRVPLARTADRDLTKWADELDQRDRQQANEKAALRALAAEVEKDANAAADQRRVLAEQLAQLDRKSTRLNSSHQIISYAV